MSNHRQLPPGLVVPAADAERLLKRPYLIVCLDAPMRVLRGVKFASWAWSQLRGFQHPNAATPFDLRVWSVAEGRYLEENKS